MLVYPCSSLRFANRPLITAVKMLRGLSPSCAICAAAAAPLQACQHCPAQARFPPHLASVKWSGISSRDGRHCACSVQHVAAELQAIQPCQMLQRQHNCCCACFANRVLAAHQYLGRAQRAQERTEECGRCCARVSADKPQQSARSEPWRQCARRETVLKRFAACCRIAGTWCSWASARLRDLQHTLAPVHCNVVNDVHESMGFRCGIANVKMMAPSFARSCCR